MRVWMLGVLVAAGCSGGTTTGTRDLYIAGDAGPEHPVYLVGKICEPVRGVLDPVAEATVHNATSTDAYVRFRASDADGGVREYGEAYRILPGNQVPVGYAWPFIDSECRGLSLEWSRGGEQIKIADTGMCVLAAQLPACDGGP
jgi:hypothetical protein